MLDLFQAPIRVHLRPFAVKNRLPGPPEPPERPKWTANERKFTQMGRPDPVLGHFHAFRGHPPVLSPPRTAYGYPTSAPPLRPRCESFSTEKCLTRGPFCEIGITWRPKICTKPPSRGFSASPPVPYSPNPQPVAPLTRLRISAMLLPVMKNHPAT